MPFPHPLYVLGLDDSDSLNDDLNDSDSLNDSENALCQVCVSACCLITVTMRDAKPGVAVVPVFGVVHSIQCHRRCQLR